MALKVADPSDPPSQDTFVIEEIVTVAAPILLTVTMPVTTHPVASVTSTLYPPAANPVAVSLVCAPGSSHR